VSLGIVLTLFFSTLKDLPYIVRVINIIFSMLSDLLQYTTEGKIKEPNLAAEAGQGILSAATSYLRGDLSGAMSGVSSVFKTATGEGKKADDYARRTRTSPADVVCGISVMYPFAFHTDVPRFLGVGAKIHKLGGRNYKFLSFPNKAYVILPAPTP
jgi:hypothetical protein